MSKFGRRHSIKRRETAKSQKVWAADRAQTRLTVQTKARMQALKADPVLAEALALGAVITAIPARSPAAQTVEQPRNAAPEPQPAATVEKRSETDVLTDFELLRLAIARSEFSEARLWYYARQLDDGSGRISKTALYAHVQRLGIVASKRTLDSILARGQGTYWRIYTGRDSELHIALTGWKRLAEQLATAEFSKQAERVETDRPGARRVWVDLSGDQQTAQSRIYAAWMSRKAEKFGFIRISRARLQQLWGRSTRQLIRWEKIARIRVEECYAEGDYTDPKIPGYAYLCLQEDGTPFASWRTTNRYHVPTTADEHPHAGQRRKVRAAVNRIMDNSEPVYKHADGRRTGRLHFFDHQSGKRWIFGFKVLRRHLAKHGDVFDRRHYVRTGQRHSRHIEELSTGDVFRRIDQRRDFKREQSPEFKDAAMRWRIGWSDRNA